MRGQPAASPAVAADVALACQNLGDHLCRSDRSILCDEIRAEALYPALAPGSDAVAETEELKRLLPSILSIQVPLIAMTGKRHSRLARVSTVALVVAVEREACKYNLTPTTSTTAMLAIGDALAMAAMDARGFREEDFA